MVCRTKSIIWGHRLASRGNPGYWVFQTCNQRVVGSIPTALTKGDHGETHPFMSDSPRMTPASASLLSLNDSLRESHEVFALRFVRLGS